MRLFLETKDQSTIFDCSVSDEICLAQQRFGGAIMNILWMSQLKVEFMIYIYMWQGPSGIIRTSTYVL